MNNLNDETKNAKVSVELDYTSESNDQKDWKITTTAPIYFDRDNANVLPAGSTFAYNGSHDETKEDVENYIASRGIFDACNVSQAEAERMLVEEAE